MKKRSILQIIDTLSLGGAERVCVDLTNLLHQKDVGVSLLTFQRDGVLTSELHPEISIIPFTRIHKFHLGNAYQLAKIIKKYAIVHVHMRHVYRYVKAVCLLFGVSTKIILHDHYGTIALDTSVPKFFNSILKPTFYIGVSNTLTSWATNVLHVKNVFLLPNTVRQQKTVQPTTIANGWVLVGNIKPLKNQLFALQLAAKMKQNITFIGAIQNQQYFKKLQEEIERLQVQDQVVFLHNVTDVQELLPQFELALMTSKSESGPLVLVEYIAQQLPFISFATGEVYEVLKNELPSFFMNTFSHSKWAQRIAEIMTKNHALEHSYTTYFSQESYTNQCLKIYENIQNS